MQKVLVTGATGFVGNYVVAELLRRKYQVIATSSSLEKAEKMPWFNQVTYMSFNFKDFDDHINYFKFFNEPDLLIHLAWEGLPNYKSDFHLTENLPRHLAFLKNIFNNGLSDITVTGTCFEYGMQEGKLSETMDTKPANAYAIAKDELREKMQELVETGSLSLKWVRLFYMFGVGQSPNSLLPQLHKALAEGNESFNMSGGEQQRDFLPVQKVAEYIVLTAAQNNVTGVINICSGKPVKVKDFVYWYLKEIKKEIQLNLGYYPYADYEPMNFWGDPKKLHSITSLL
ncbi:MAG: NAD-dependent epimerase/dehydratase family protein [Ferruginibacter sp.]